MDSTANLAENKLQTTSYHGEKKRWDFEEYVRTHVDQHAILSGLTKHGYSGIDNWSKARNLLEGINTKEFDSVKTSILASPVLQNNFDSCLSHLLDALDPEPFRVEHLGYRNNER